MKETRAASTKMEGRNLLDLPDVVLRNVLQYLTVEDRISLLLVDERFEHLTSGRHISRYVFLSKTYQIYTSKLLLVLQKLALSLNSTSCNTFHNNKIAIGHYFVVYYINDPVVHTQQ